MRRAKSQGTTEDQQAHGCHVGIVPLTTLAPERLELLREIPVSIRSTDEDFVASFFDANVSASGETEQEAFANLRDMLVLTYNFLHKKPEAELAPILRKQRVVLDEFIRAK